MSLSCWDGEMMRDNERWIIKLGFDGNKRAYKLLLFKSNWLQLLKLGLFNDRARIVWARLARVRLARARLAWDEPELNHEPEFFYAALVWVPALIYEEKHSKHSVAEKGNTGHRRKTLGGMHTPATSVIIR
jgi:hypothetical protein